MNKLLSILILISFISCLDVPKKKNNHVDPNAVYFDYRISAAETEKNAVIYLQFRSGDKDGNSLRLDSPSKVILDLETIDVDSAGLTGSYYEIQKPINSFSGKHEIVFVDKHGKKFTEKFSFTPFKLKTTIPPVVMRGDLVFNFDGLEKLDLLRVVATDTSFASNDINQFDTVRNGRLVIPESHLRNLVDGSINIIFSKEVEKPVKNGTSAGGRMEVSYEVRKEFVLKSGE